MNRTALVRIQAAVLGSCLAAQCVAGPVSRDDSAPGRTPPNLEAAPASVVPVQRVILPDGAISLVGSVAPQAGGTASPAAEDSTLDRVANDVPAADPLPAEATSLQSPRQARPGNAGTAPRTPEARGNASGRAPAQQGARQANQNDRPQEIEFDPQGLITLHTNELDVRQLLELISRRSGLNILVSPNVQGSITANFEKISVDELIKSVLKLSNLVEKVEGDVHYIYSRDDIRDEAENKKKERILTKVYRLNYVRADELMVMIAPFLSPDVGRKRFSTSANYLYGISESSTLATSGMGGTGTAPVGGAAGGAGAAGAAVGGAGTIQRGTQPPTGGFSMSNNDMVVIQDYESNLKIVDQIIHRIDIRPVQVLIEAVIISVELAKDKELGVNFALVDNLGQQLGTIGAGAAINGNVGFTPAQVLTAAGKIAASNPADPTGFASATNGIKYGFVSNNVTGFIRAIETLGSTKVLASPRILVLNKQRAEIQLGSRLGFRTLSQNYTSTIQQIQFLNTGTLLRIRPFVSTDGMVRMEIHPERSSGVVQDDLPSARTAELTTNVMVPDGATLVIGGLMEDEDTYQQQGLPGISRMPLLGHVFGLKQKTDTRRELVVLLTPHVWAEADPLDNQAELALRGTSRPSQDLRRASTEPAPRTPPAAMALGSAPRNPLGGAWRQESLPSLEAVTAAGSRSGSPPAGPAPLPGLGTAPAAGPRASDHSSSSSTFPPADPAVVPETDPRPIKPSTLPSNPPETEQPADRATVKLRRASLQVEFQPVVQHRVAEGETLQSIAHRYYGSARYAAALWEANRAVLARSRGLEPGVDLSIPALNELDPTMVDAIRAAEEGRSTTMTKFVDSAVPVANTTPSRPAYRKAGLAGGLATAAEIEENASAMRSPASAVGGLEDDAPSGLTGTLESEPATQLSDVIDPNSPVPAEPMTAGRVAKRDPMVARAGIEQSATAERSGTPPGARRADGSWPAPAPGEAAGGASPLASPAFAIPDLEPAPVVTPAAQRLAPPGRDPSVAFPSVPDARTIESTLEAGANLPETDEGGFAVHVVRKDETMRSIARDRLGDARRAGELIEMNREMLGDDLQPRPGMRVVLPRRGGRGARRSP